MRRVSIPRIKSVTLKKGGAKLYVFENPDARETTQALERDIAHILGARKNDMVGYAVLAWSREGSTSASIYVRDGRWVGITEVPDFVKTALQSYLADSS